MANFNNVTIAGNLTRDPEPGQTQGGSNFCKFSVAVNDFGKDGEQRANFFDVTAWGKTADNIVKYLSKGSPILIGGKLRQERWTNQEGQNRSKVTITALIVQFIGSKGEQAAAPSGGLTHAPVEADADDDNPDEFPF